MRLLIISMLPFVHSLLIMFFFFFFFNDTATTEIYTLSLHDALPISVTWQERSSWPSAASTRPRPTRAWAASSCVTAGRSEEHTSELQSQSNLVCRLLLEKKKKKKTHKKHDDRYHNMIRSQKTGTHYH